VEADGTIDFQGVYADIKEESFEFVQGVGQRYNLIPLNGERFSLECNDYCSTFAGDAQQVFVKDNCRLIKHLMAGRIIDAYLADAMQGFEKINQLGLSQVGVFFLSVFLRCIHTAKSINSE
jgi:hypothetical protein